jgi:predicted deacetylase
MQSTDSTYPTRRLCVSIHDVAPATWTECRTLLEAVAAVADIPLTLLVVPVPWRCRNRAIVRP